MIVARTPSACAVYLSGSFGRGEGSVVPWGAAWRPLGDYDFYVVGTSSPGVPSLEADLLAQWDRAYGGAGPSFGITVEVVRESSLAGLPPDTSTYEFQRTARLLSGREVRRRIAFGSHDIPLMSGLRALLNKLVGLLENAPWSPGCSPVDLEYEVWRLYLDAVATLLLARGRYTAGYRRRGEVFRSVGGGWADVGVPDLLEKADWALERKLRPVFSSTEPATLWGQGRTDLSVLLASVAGAPPPGAPASDGVPWLTSWLQQGYYQPWVHAWLVQRLGTAPPSLVKRLASVAQRREARRFGAPATAHVPACLYGAAAGCLYASDDDGTGEAARLLRRVGVTTAPERQAVRSAVLDAFDRYRRGKPSKRGIGP
jgi:hypothetical protein